MAITQFSHYHRPLQTDYQGVTGRKVFDEFHGPIKKRYDIVNFQKETIVKVSTNPENLFSLLTQQLFSVSRVAGYSVFQSMPFQVGSWDKDDGLAMANKSIVWNKMGKEKPTSSIKSLKGTLLKLGVTQEPPFISIDMNCSESFKNDRELQKQCFTGLCIGMIMGFNNRCSFLQGTLGTFGTSQSMRPLSC